MEQKTTNQELPDEPSFSFKEGTWVCFIHGDDTVHFWHSSTNGKERLYLNHKLVRETKNLTKMNVVELLEGTNGDRYRLELRLTRIDRAITRQYSFYVNDKVKEGYKMYRTPLKRIDRLKIALLIGLPIIAMSIFFKISGWFTLLSWVVFLATFVIFLVVYSWKLKGLPFNIERIDYEEDPE